MYDDLRNPTAKRLYVLFDDNSYLAVSDSWRDGDNPDSCPSIGTVPGLIKPVRGFGRVWCERQDVRGRLPGALSSEQGVTLKIQQFERGVMWGQAEGNTVAILDDGTWR